MNPPSPWLRSTIFMDLRGESPIGAWATHDDCPQLRRSGDVTASTDVNGEQPFDSTVAQRPGQSQPAGSGSAWLPKGRMPLKKSSDFGRPRRRCLDFLLLIGAFAALDVLGKTQCHRGPRKHGTQPSTLPFICAHLGADHDGGSDVSGT